MLMVKWKIAFLRFFRQMNVVLFTEYGPKFRLSAYWWHSLLQVCVWERNVVHWSFSLNVFTQFSDKKYYILKRQDCIPVGCVPSARWPYLPACSAPGGVCSGGCLLPGGVCSRGVSAPRGGVCWRGDGGVVVGMLLDRHPHPLLWTESHTPVKT